MRSHPSRIWLNVGSFSVPAALGLALVAGCSGDIGDSGTSIERIQEGLSGCRGQASSSIPSDGKYFLTTFGFSPSDDGLMSCGTRTNHGSWYYAASRQRYGCGSAVRIVNPANGRCVVARTDDYGPDVCVERAAGRPIIDASPLVGTHLFGSRSAGWSDRFLVTVEEVDAGTPLGPCSASGGTGGGTSGGTGGGTSGGTGGGGSTGGGTSGGSCSSATLDRTVSEGTCVQSVSDRSWYHCDDGAWVGGRTGCSQSFGWCDSATLGRAVPPRTCVQSRRDRLWYQCGSQGWESGVAGGEGPVGDCASMHSL